MWLPVIFFVAVPLIALADREFFAKWMASESQGILEAMHWLFSLITALIGLRLLFTEYVRADPLLIAWCAAIFVGGVYLAGEEASWGQHYFGWTTSGEWAQINDQQETNIHNTSHLLDQLPRAILQGGIIVAGLVWPWILLNKPELLPRRLDFTYPPLALRPLAILIAACWLYRALSKSDTFGDYLIHRPGEFQESFIVWYLLYYALFLYWREKSLHT